MRVKAAGRSSHGVGGNNHVRRKIIFRAITGDVLRDVRDKIGRSRSKIAAAGTCRVKTVRACRRGTRMKVLRAREILREQRRAANRAGFVHEEAASSLMRKQ